ncbi:MAG TPA: hypothetical protein PK668_01905 [Myxococcota bacterium]|nr:hypothetical protein [Myxococcota bacterium]HRY94678.1 hypothetical protein [Myxococcota bacterium]HSA22091.1 hypothetical protein [Myxococcota bacterium]
MAKRDWQNGVILGCVIGLLLGGVGVGLLVRACERSEIEQVKAGWTLVPVLVFSLDLQAGVAVDYDHVAKMQVPELFVTPSVIRPRELEQFIGRKLRYPVSRGDLIVLGVFEPRAAPAGAPGSP